MQLLRVKPATWLAMLFLCLLFYICTSCGSNNDAGASSSPNTSTPQSTSSPQDTPIQSPITTATNTRESSTALTTAQPTATIATDNNNPAPTPTIVVATPTKAIDIPQTATAVAISQTATAIAISQTMTAVATTIQSSYPTVTAVPTATPTPTPPLLEVDKTSLHASTDCTTSLNADGNNHAGWICPLTLTNNGSTDANWTSSSSDSNVEIYVQDTQTWNQGIVPTGQQQQVDFVVLGGTSTCSGSYTSAFNSSYNPISVSWNC